MPSRSTLQKLARQRLADATVLLAADQPDTAFYLAGYAIECALKAAVCRTLDQDDFYQPDRTNKEDRTRHNASYKILQLWAMMS